MGGWVGQSCQITKDGINLDIIEIIGLYLKIYGQLIRKRNNDFIDMLRNNGKIQHGSH